MEEKLRIVVEADGTFTIKRELVAIGLAGVKAADQISGSLKHALRDMAYNTRVAVNSTKLADKARVESARASAQQVIQARKNEADMLRWQTQVAMASTRLAEKARVDAARAAAQQIAALRRSEAQAAKDAAKAAVSAKRAAGKEEVAIARATRRAELAHRQKLRDAKKDATFGLGGGFAGVLGLLGLREVVSGFIEYSDAAVNVSNRLKMVTDSEEQLVGLTMRLKDVALDARSEFDLTTRTYARLAQSTRQLELSQGANLAMTETLTKSISVSGATGAEAHATLIQLSQAMASNRLSADEYRSVAEQLPIILDLLSASTGKARTELKAMGEAGQLTSRVMSLALLEGLDTIRAKFDETMPTIEQSWENVRTETRFAIEEFNKATGASGQIVKALQWAANNMDTVTIAVKALGAAIGVYLVTQIGLAVMAASTLAIAHPWIAAATAVAGLIALVMQYNALTGEGKGFNTKHRTLDQVNAVRAEPGMKGKSLTDVLAEMDDRDRLLALDETNIGKAVGAENQELDRRFAIADLRSQKDSIKSKKKGRGAKGPSSFEDAVRQLEQDVAQASLTENQREVYSEALQIQAAMQKNLTQEQGEYVVALVKEKKTLEAIRDARESVAELKQKRYDEDTKNIVEAKRQAEEDQIASLEIRKEQLRLENKIHRGPSGVSDIGSPEDILEARKATLQMVGGGRISKGSGSAILDQLEINDENTNPIRKLFLEESTGIGKFAESVNGIFGTEGTLATGFADAAANAIVFKESFSKSINALGKQIQAEIISTLIQGLIRMAILGAMGGGKSQGAALAAQSSLAAVGKPNAQGGFINGGRTQVAGYVHGGEYVVNAEATQQNRSLLETINKGGKAAHGGSRGARGVNIVFEDHVGVRLEAQQMDDDHIKLIARQEVSKHAGRVVAGNIRNANSSVGKALRGNTTTRYQR